MLLRIACRIRAYLPPGSRGAPRAEGRRYCWYPSTSDTGRTSAPSGLSPYSRLRPALTQQVPALVERLFSRTKTLPLLFRAELARAQLAPELVLGLDQVADPRHDLLVIHVLKVCRPPGARSGRVIERLVVPTRYP